MERLTEDHTIVSLLLELGQITKKEAKNHPSHHVITRYVGMDGRQGPDINLITLKPGDRLLLCSDGLTNMVTDREMGTILFEEADIPEACKKLVDMANNAGGKDNITVIVIQYGEKDKKSDKKVRIKRDVKINKVL
jgi:protein phosphatase